MKKRLIKYYLRLRDIWIAKPLFAAAVVFLLIFAVYSIVYIPSAGVSAKDDHFFHFRIASLLREKGWDALQNFSSIYLTESAAEHVRFQVTLFHFALIPFTYIKDAILGLKISDIFWASLVYSSFYYLLRKIRIKWALFYVLILMTFPFLSSRMLMGRAFILTPVLIFGELYLAGKRKYLPLFLLTVFHVFWHQATFFMPIAVVGMVEISRYLVEKQFAKKNFLAAALGTIAGMAFFSGFPGSLWVSLKGLVTISQDIVNIPNMDRIEGVELVPVSLLSFWNRSDSAVLILILSFSVFVYYYLTDRNIDPEEKRRDKYASWRILAYPAFLLSFLFFCFSILSSGRLLDFYFFSAIFILALTAQRFFSEEGKALTSRFRYFIFAGILIFFFVAFLNALSSFKGNVKNNNYDAVKTTAEWVKEKSSDNENVFLFRWDDFPEAFFYDQKNRYTMGIEPKALFKYNPGLFWKWYNIFLYDYYCDFPGDCSEKKKDEIELLKGNQEKIDAYNIQNSKQIINSIKKDFKSRFIISTNADFNSVIWQNQEMVEDSLFYSSDSNGMQAAAFQLK